MRKTVGEVEVSVDGAMGEHMGVNALKLLDTKTFSSDVVALHCQPGKTS